MKILAIGNSFSQDASRFMHQIAAAGGVELEINNLYIGGCSLERHWKNVEGDLAAYSWEQNGQATGKMVTSKEMLHLQSWDVVTLQQVSGESGRYETFQPYLKQMAAFIRSCNPGAKQWIHQTWAYEYDSQHPDFAKYDSDQDTMFRSLKCAYACAAKSIGAAGIIPCGEVIQELRRTPEFDYENGGQSLHRDGFHLHLLYGRYAAAATWVAALTGMTLRGNSFLPEENGQQAEPELIERIQTMVDRHFGR